MVEKGSILMKHASALNSTKGISVCDFKPNRMFSAPLQELNNKIT